MITKIICLFIQKHSHGRPDTNPAVLFLWTLVYLLFRIFHYVKDIFLNWIFNSMIPERFEKMPPIRDEHFFVSRSAVELARSIRTKEITSVQLVQACIERIELVNTCCMYFLQLLKKC